MLAVLACHSRNKVLQKCPATGDIHVIKHAANQHTENIVEKFQPTIILFMCQHKLWRLKSMQHFLGCILCASYAYVQTLLQAPQACGENSEELVRIVSPLFKHVLTVQICNIFMMLVMTLTNWHCLDIYYILCWLIPTKEVVTYPNIKPWVTKELKSVINKKKLTYHTGDPLEKKGVSREVHNEIRSIGKR